jgi:hypothetical protein
MLTALIAGAGIALALDLMIRDQTAMQLSERNPA